MSNINIKIPDSVDAAIEGLTKKPAQSIGETLNDCWFLAFGGLSQKAEKKRLKYSYDLKAYKSSLEQAINQIPPENQQEAKLCVVGPALEKSKYCVEETEIRDMFVNLIAHSMDNRFSSIVHPSFPEIISQMSPLDAENIKLFSHANYLPIAKYRNIFCSDNFTPVQSNVFLSNPNMQDIKLQASSISVLSRLGLINITYEEYMIDETQYLLFEQHPFLENLKKHISSAPVDGFQSPRDDRLIKNVDFQKGLAILTPLGKDFLNVCLPQIIISPL